MENLCQLENIKSVQINVSLKVMTKEQEEIKKTLNDKYECFIAFGQEKEFEKTDLYVRAYTTNIYNLLKDAFTQYEPLMDIAKDVIKEIESEKDSQ